MRRGPDQQVLPGNMTPAEVHQSENLRWPVPKHTARPKWVDEMMVATLDSGRPIFALRQVQSGNLYVYALGRSELRRLVKMLVRAWWDSVTLKRGWR